MATSGTISKNIGKNNVYTFWIEWAQNSKSEANNTSNITVTLKARRNDGYPSYGAYNNYGNNTIKLTVGGSVKVNNTAANIDLRTSTGVTLATWTGDVAHNSDGTLNLALEGYFYFNSSAASSLPKGGYTVSGTASLDAIPRKSSVTCTDANVGSSAVITISRASTSFRHTLTYSFGSLSGTIVSKTANTSIGWTLPTTFYAQMPKRTRKGTITCETFDSSGNSLGTTSCTFTATAVDTVSVSGTVVDTNSKTIALTGNSSKLIKYFSTAKATISASTNNSAIISSKTINGAEVSADKTFANCETPSFIFYAKDSRDYSNSATVKPDMIQYIKLTNNASASRVSPTGDTINLSLSGNFFNGSFGAANNTLTCKYRYCISGGTLGDYQTVTATKSGNSYSYSVTLSGFDYKNSYTIDVVISDALMTVSKSIALLKGTPVFDWGENDFKFNVPAQLAGGQWVHSAYGDRGTDVQYVKIAELTPHYAYTDMALTIRLIQRGQTIPTALHIRFAGDNTTDPGLSEFSAVGAYTNYWLGKESTSKWGLYAQKIGAYDEIGVLELEYPPYVQTRVGVAWTDEVVSSVDGATKCNAATLDLRLTNAFGQGNGESGYVVLNGYGICWGYINITVSISNAWGSMYYGRTNTEINYPLGFASSPSISLTCEQNGGNVTGVTAAESNVLRVNGLYFYAPDSRTTDVWLHWCARGKLSGW